MAKLLVSPNSTSAQPPASPVDTGLPQTVTMSPVCHAASGTGWSLRPALGPLPRGPLRLQVWAETGAQAGVLSCPQGLAHTHLPPWPEGVAAQTGPVASLWAEAHIKDQDPGLGGPCHPASGRCLGGASAAPTSSSTSARFKSSPVGTTSSWRWRLPGGVAQRHPLPLLSLHSGTRPVSQTEAQFGSFWGMASNSRLSFGSLTCPGLWPQR